MGTRSGSSEISRTRTSKTGWLHDSQLPAVARLTRRVARVTGLRTDPDQEDAELLQVHIAVQWSKGVYITKTEKVANYMNGGHYNPHHDYVMREKAPDHVSCNNAKDH